MLLDSGVCVCVVRFWGNDEEFRVSCFRMPWRSAGTRQNASMNVSYPPQSPFLNLVPRPRDETEQRPVRPEP